MSNQSDSKPKYPGVPVTVNGNYLVAKCVETRITEGGVFYPITPSTEGGELYQEAFAMGELDVWGNCERAGRRKFRSQIHHPTSGVTVKDRAWPTDDFSLAHRSEVDVVRLGGSISGCQRNSVLEDLKTPHTEASNGGTDTQADTAGEAIISSVLYK